MTKAERREYEAVIERDGYCAGPAAGFPLPCQGPPEIDHIDNGGHGRRGPTVRANLMRLCQRHHRWKTDHATRARELQHDRIAEFYGLGL